MDPTVSHNSQHAAAIDRDLFCLECGYNLRGLCGDPCRCPECGYANPLGDVQLPAELISRQLRRMETAPAGCATMILVGAPVLVACTVISLAQGPPRAAEWLCPLSWLCFCGAMWWGAVLRFRSSCRARPGWWAALTKYQAIAVGLAALVVTWVWGSIYLLIGARLELPAGILLIAVAAAGWGLKASVQWAYVVAKRDMEPLQRQVAVVIAREVLRKRLAGMRGRSRRLSPDH